MTEIERNKFSAKEYECNILISEKETISVSITPIYAKSILKIAMLSIDCLFLWMWTMSFLLYFFSLDFDKCVTATTPRMRI